MCGIFFSIAEREIFLPDDATQDLLKARGPDSFQSITVKVGRAHHPTILGFASSVLALRGNDLQKQPLLDENSSSVFCWNGEAWKSNGQQVTGNDALFVFHTLLSAAASENPSTTITQALADIAGPFAFVFYDGLTSTVYYGRDRLGRRSLVLRQDLGRTLTICSLSDSRLPSVDEVPTNCIFSIVLSDETPRISSLPWPGLPPQINADIPSEVSLLGGTIRDATAVLTTVLTASLKLRVLNIPDHQATHAQPSSARMAILFSGGVDCALVARMCHDILPLSCSIDLLNVAFENPRAMQARSIEDSPYDICPDRITGWSSFAELLQVCPGRCWRFVAVNVPYQQAKHHESTILQLLRPHNTEMDLSIGMALYFAARGEGRASISLDPSQTPVPYKTPARVLLSGLGADELFGGYSRHATAFSRAGYAGLIQELDLDFSRIGQRNLGRDDRIISYWGKEVRYPYLDEDFSRIALGLPVWAKCGFRIGRRIPKHYETTVRVERAEDLEPSKQVLRLMLWNLGMKKAASERKRAIQFGAKTAKMELASGKRKGTQVLMT